ncbi:MAG TPA: hypothetical protein VF175_04635 [Lacipirellula sp.]
MTLQTVPPFVYPGFTLRVGGSLPAVANGTQLNAAGEYDSVVFRPGREFTPTHIAFVANAVAADSEVDCRLETVDDTTGLPSGTLVAANANGLSGTIPSGSTGWKQIALTSAPTIGPSADVAIKIAWVSGDLTVARMANYGVLSEKPYQVANTGAPTKGTSHVIVALYDGSTYLLIPGVFPFSGITGGSFNSDTASGSGGDERGVRFRLPFKARACAIRTYDAAASGDFDVLITDDSGNELSSSAAAVDASNQLGNHGWAENPLANPVTLDANTWYRAFVRPSTTTNTNLLRAILNSAAVKTALPCGVDWNYCFRTDGGAPDDTGADACPLIDLVFDQLDDGEGGGSGDTGGLTRFNTGFN